MARAQRSPASLPQPELLAAGAFSRLAQAVEGSRPQAELFERMEDARRACEAAAARAESSDMRDLLINVQSALRTWREVWPRLGTEQPFRLAVAREARLWAKRLGGVDG